MRMANVAGRLALIDERGAVDVETVSAGAFSPDPQEVFDRWDEFSRWVAANASVIAGSPTRDVDETQMEAPVPRPRQVFGTGLTTGTTPRSPAWRCPRETRWCSRSSSPRSWDRTRWSSCLRNQLTSRRS